TGSGTTATHAYASPGNYIILLTLTRGSQTATNDASLTYVTVTEPALDIASITNQTPPFAQFAASGQVVQTNTKVDFDASGSGAWVPNPKFNSSDPVQ